MREYRGVATVRVRNLVRRLLVEIRAGAQDLERESRGRSVIDRAARRLGRPANPSDPQTSMTNLLKDLQFGVRSLARKPGSAALSIVAFGLGIGLTTVMFSIVYGIFFRGLGVPEADDLVLIKRTNVSRGLEQMWVSQHDFYDWREQQEAFEDLAGFYTGTVNLSGTEGPERYDGGFVTANVFDVLRVRPILGRSFQQGDGGPGAPMTVILGYGTWRDRFDADPGVLGRNVTVNGEPGTVIGVMPEGFLFPATEELWVPMRDSRSEMDERHQGSWFVVMGRLKDGVTRDQAELEFAAIAQRLAQEYPEANEGISVRFQTFVEDSIGSDAIPVFGAMMVATIFVLLIACANVANLLLARASLRTKEAAVRSAIGGSRLRIVFPFFSEALILSLAGAVLGTVIAFVGVRLFNDAITGVGKPYWIDITVDLPILLYVFGVTLVTALASGAAPALQISRTDVNGVLKDESRGSSSFHLGRLSRILVVGEVALSFALLVGAGLMTKSVVQLSNRDYNFSVDDVFTARVGLFETVYPDQEARRRFYRDLRERLQAMPGAESVALTTNLPAAGTGRRTFAVEGEVYETERSYPEARVAITSPDLFRTFGVSLSSGRDFTTQDDLDAPEVAIVNQRFVERFFPGEDPVGRRIREGGADSENAWKTIVGVVPNLDMAGLDPESDEAGYYVPLEQSDARFMSIAVKARGGNPLALTPQVRETVRAADSELPIYNVRDMNEVIRQSTWVYHVFGSLFIVFGAAALFLASVGLYGVLAFSVSRRFQELGIRMALGAGVRDVLGLVLRQGLLQVGIGLAIGLVLALFVSSTASLLMFEVEPRDPAIFGAIVFVIVLVGLLASVVPARRAVAVDPMVALRYE